MAHKMILKNALIDLVIVCFIAISGGQTCVNNPNANQRGQVFITSGRQVIVPRAKFNCSGRITNVAVSMQRQVIVGGNLPLFQVWHPTSLDSSTYNKIGEVQLPEGEFVAVGVDRNYHHANLPLNGNSRIEFQSGDVIGYYQPLISQRLIWNIETSGYTSYSTTVTSPSISIDISTVENADDNHQPLFAVIFDIQCNNLSIPTNGNASCSSGTVGVGYEGDTCSFTCNTGYELSNSNTIARTCQSDGSWNGTDNDCRRVPCPPLDNPNDGMINCSLGDDNFTSYEDICSFTCNTGYELIGNGTRICQSDGNWSSNANSLCKRVQCTSLSSPTNGNISCNSTDVSLYEDQCSFSCDLGYELTGSSSRQCLSNRSWSGEPVVTCNILKCSGPEVEITNSQSIGNCNLTYGSKCLLNCLSGFTASGNNALVCDDVNEEGTLVKWRSLGDDFTCADDDTTRNTGNNNEDGEASSDDSSNAAAIGGAIGGALVLLLIIVLILAVILVYVKMSQKKQNTPSNIDSYSNKMYEASTSIIPVNNMPDYEEANFTASQKDNNSVVETALSSLERTSGPVYAFQMK